MDGMVTAGRVGGLFGNKGELTLILYDPFPREPTTEELVFVEIDGHSVPLFFERFARRGVKGATAVFADIDNVARATELIGHTLYLREQGGGDKSRRGKPGGGWGGEGGEQGGETDDELFFDDFVGWEVWLDSGQKGRVTDYFEEEFNPLFEVEFSGETVLIPAVEDFIVEIDESTRRITLSIPEGLLGLNK
jgi:16S rRNA processing protein RimM